MKTLTVTALEAECRSVECRFTEPSGAMEQNLSIFLSQFNVNLMNDRLAFCFDIFCKAIL
jgi:hypothetical protein